LSSFVVTETPLEGLAVVERIRREDERGFLVRMFCKEEMAVAGWNKDVVQINETHTIQAGTVRGMHFQLPPHAEMKLVSCLKGEVLDVAVDIREGSPTFLQWHGEILSADNCRSLMIPEGFAHGFQTLSPDVQMLYVHSSLYNPEYERGLNPLDKKLNIKWPQVINGMSEKDRSASSLDSEFKGVQL
jgi:dTDP-4-dehydrorhamnose 3,5-epimerase